MRTVRVGDPVVAVLCADIHLSIKPPIARAGEPNWFRAMLRPIEQISLIAQNHSCPVIVAGDIFDRWNSPPELINWALRHLPCLYAIPGNHDLPHHRPDLIHRSAYGTLVETGTIKELGFDPIDVGRDMASVLVYGREFDEDPPHTLGGDVEVLVTHEYLWDTGTGHVDAPIERRLDKVAHKFSGFDVVVVGDNHVPFERTLKGGKTYVHNCGTVTRRKTNEAQYPTRVGLLRLSGKVDTMRLNTDGDKIALSVTKAEESQEENEDITALVEAMANVEDTSLDFREALHRAMDARKVDRKVRTAILEALGE